MSAKKSTSASAADWRLTFDFISNNEKSSLIVGGLAFLFADSLDFLDLSTIEDLGFVGEFAVRVIPLLEY